MFMPPIGWCWALAVWVYTLELLFINDRLKLAPYRILDLQQLALTTRR